MIEIAQIIKIMDYRSRYEADPFSTPGNFFQYKQHSWQQLVQRFEEGTLHQKIEELWLEEDISFFQKVKMKWLKKAESFEEVEELYSDEKEEAIVERDDFSEFEERFQSTTIESEDQLRQKFLEFLFEKKVSWATTNSSPDMDPIVRKLQYNKKLFEFSQATPDNLLLFYQPVVQVGKAEVELDLILITPLEIWCITRVDGATNSVFESTNKRYWIERTGIESHRIISPIPSLFRTSRIIGDICKASGLELPIRKAIIAPENYFDVPYPPHGVAMIDKRNFKSWFGTFRNEKASLKFQQIKTAERILAHCVYS
ncbi:MAG: hypothetical protein ACRCWQ_06060 [Bacilli bacterium]